ncbi:MAG TPA: nucleotide exchange factor GrpE [Solirubrobacterales bacterium]
MTETRDAEAAIDPAPAANAAEDSELALALRHELDQVLPHVVTALKRHDGVAELHHRLDLAEKRLADREQRPLVNGLRRVLGMVRKLDFDPDTKDAIASELERVLVGAGYEEFGEVGESFDPQRHEAVEGTAGDGPAMIVELLEPGLETLGEVVARAKVEVGTGGES